MDAGFLKKHRKAVIVVVLCLCIAAATVGGVLAYLTAQTDMLSNAFFPAKVSCAVEEVFGNGVKEDVRVRNTGNIDAYIRAVVVTTFVSEEGKVLAQAPQEGVDHTVSWGKTGWVKGTDGYWYHTKAVAPNEQTATLIETASAVSAPDGYRLNVQIVASAIQSAPERAVEEAWGVTFSDGELVPN